MSPSLVLYIPITLLIGGLIITLVGSIRRRLAYPVFWIFLLGSALASLFGLLQVLRDGAIHYELGGWAPPMGIEYVLDPLSAFMAVLITGVAILVMIYAKKSVADELPGRDTSFYAVSALLLAGLLGIVVTGDLFNLYVFLEIASLAAYALLSIGEKRAPLAAFRYVLLGTISASFYLIGIGLLYSKTGTLNMADLASQMNEITSFRSVQLAAVFIVTAMGIKMALFPLHLWLPDAYTYAPSAVTGLIAPLMTKVSAYAMIRLLLFVMGPAFVRDQIGVTHWIAWASAAGILAGSILAIAQKDLKRMLAYSSVSQIAYVGLGIGLGNALGFIGAVLHILNHALMKACLFLVAGIIRYKHGPITIDQFAGLGRRMPLTMAAFVIAALSMVGLPPTAGFFSKWYLVLGGIESRQWVFVAVILVSSLLNAVYFFNVLEKVYLARKVKEKDEGHEKKDGWDEAPVGLLIPTIILALGVLAAGLANAVIVEGLLRKALPPGM